jgi:Flp pilus assembly protein TadD
MIRTGSSGLEERAARMRELLARDGADEVVWFGLGQTLLALGRPAEAVDPLREAVRLRPDYSAAHRDLGRALLEAGRSEEAARVLERAAQVAEATRDLQTGREIAVLLRKAAASPARSEAKPSEDPGAGAGSAADPRGPETAASLSARQLAREALRQLANDRLERAIALYERALEADPGLGLAWNGLSVAWRLRGDLDRAIEAARRLAELEPDDPLSHTNLSILYQARGMIPEAEDEKAIAMRLQMRSRR